MREIQSEGKCIYCNEVYSKTEIGKHLAYHFAKMDKADVKKQTKQFCHIVVEAEEMFLHLLVDANATMKKIDNFLKDIWLDCCGHMSSFGHKNFKVGMKNRVGDIFDSRVKIYHDYDFGDTTTIFIRGLKNYNLNQKKDIILLSRNEPLKIMCSICKTKPAVNVCVNCWWDDDAFFCDNCSEEHGESCTDFLDYASMPVVNSPRMGVCGYDGGCIDKGRDGIYQK